MQDPRRGSQLGEQWNVETVRRRRTSIRQLLHKIVIIDTFA